LSTLTISNNHSSNNFESIQKEVEKEVHWRRRKILENNSNSKDFSLKSSLKRSGSKLFNGLLRSLIGEDENEEEEEKEEEIEEKKNWENEEEEERFNDDFKVYFWIILFKLKGLGRFTYEGKDYLGCSKTQTFAVKVDVK